MPRVPALCSECGALFPSGYEIAPNVTSISFAGNRQRCPHCGEMADVADGVFETVDDVINVLSGPEITRDMLRALADLAKNARVNQTPLDVVEKDASEIHPSFGELVRTKQSQLPRNTLLLVLLFVAIKGCTFEATLDVNKLFDQLLDNNPATITIEHDVTTPKAAPPQLRDDGAHAAPKPTPAEQNRREAAAEQTDTAEPE